MTSTSTTPPYSGAITSSTPTPPQNYMMSPPAAPPNNSSSQFNISDWVILLISMALTGVIGFFSSLIAVKADIAENKKEISVAFERIKHNQLETSGIKDSLRNLNSVDSRVSVLDTKIQNLERVFDRQSIPQPDK